MMVRSFVLKSSAFLVAAALLAPLPAAGQSLLANRGLGVVVDPSDARARGMGGVGLGLQGSDLSWANPADAVGIPAPGLEVTFQFDEFSADLPGRTAEGSTARFPAVQLAFPVGERAVLTVGAAGFLDQNWAVERRDTLFIDGDTVPVLDRFSSEGGVTQIRLGGGYRVLEGAALGAGVDFYVGGVERAFGRRFPGEVEPGCCRTDWTYSGVGATVGLEWSNEALTVAAAASAGGTLDAETEDSLAVNASFDLPTRLSAGASGRVAGNLLVALSGEWSGWSTLDESLAEVGGARDAWSLHGGVEYDGLRLADRPLPLRLGARTAALPFRWGSEAQPTGWPDERALTGGFGLVLAGGAVQTDFGAERGSRGGGEAGIDEAFWRMTFSVTVLGR